MVYVYKTKGVCSREMTVDVDENGIIQSCVIKGGCPGNLLGISRIVIGMKAEDVLDRLEGIRCGLTPTSCPDQLAHALREMLAQEESAAQA